MLRYLSAEVAKADDFGKEFTGKVGEVVYDAKTVHGPWAMMTQESWDTYGHLSKKLGLGFGQKYVRDENGHLNIAEGGSDTAKEDIW